MSTAKHDNIVKDKIDTLAAIPEGFVFNPSAKWQQLEDKLQPQPNRKKAIWWYWAAASLLFLVVLFKLSDTKQKNAGLGHMLPLQNSQAVPIILNKTSKNIIVKIDNKPNAKLVNAATQQNVIILQKPTKPEILTVFNDAKIDIPTDIKPNPIVSTENPALLPENTDKLKPLVAISTKPKRKVLHISELGVETEQPVIIAKNEHKKIIEQEVEIVPTETNKSWWLFKPKPAPTNTYTNTSITNNQ